MCKKNEDISKTQKDLAQAEEELKVLKKTCDDQQLDIKVWKRKKTKDHEMLKQRGADRIKIENANASIRSPNSRRESISNGF